MLPSLNRSTRNYVLFNLIGSMLDRNSIASELVQQRFRILIGNGLNADFWSYNWTELEPFKEAFPRIFALVIAKQWVVTNLAVGIQTLGIGRFPSPEATS